MQIPREIPGQEELDLTGQSTETRSNGLHCRGVSLPQLGLSSGPQFPYSCTTRLFLTS